MVSSNVQRIYDEYISALSPTERLRMVELITRGMAQPEPIQLSALDPTTITEIPSWQATNSQRGVPQQWRDHTL